ncbi:MAG: adenosine kinase [Pelagibacteraceae bacterium]|jgi:fructokinase|nr:adenosine kinase [Pelagibacterales bacterium]PCH48702.1 MAG: adenosine kinase [Pelagibacteraceae bacterium]
MSKKNKALGIGNAIVDAVCKVNENFLKSHNLQKGTMKLINEDELKKLQNEVKPSEFIAGGSVANSIVGLSSFGNQVYFIGKLNNDLFGKKYFENLRKENVGFNFNNETYKDSTGICFVFITPDGERTMTTYLGIANKLSEKEVNHKEIEQSELILIEGYLWDTPEAKNAISKSIEIAIKNSTLVSLSLSDVFCVERYKKEFLDLTKNKIDLLFGNEGEFKSLFEYDNIEKIIQELSTLNKIFVITMGEKGVTLVHKKEIVKVPSERIEKVVDLTGAGDLFASGFVHGFINKMGFEKSLKLGTKSAAEIIKILGARPKKKLSDLI